MNDPVSQKMLGVLQLADRNGFVYAGGGNPFGRGSVVSVSAVTIKALARRNLLTLGTSPDGGILGRITDLGREVSRKAQSAEGANHE